MTSHVAKIVEIVGSSEKSWHDAGSGCSRRSQEDCPWDQRIRSAGYDCKSRP